MAQYYTLRSRAEELQTLIDVSVIFLFRGDKALFRIPIFEMNLDAKSRLFAESFVNEGQHYLVRAVLSFSRVEDKFNFSHRSTKCLDASLGSKCLQICL